MPDLQDLETGALLVLLWLPLWWLVKGRRPYTLTMCRAQALALVLALVAEERAPYRLFLVAALVIAVPTWLEKARATRMNRTEENTDA